MTVLSDAGLSPRKRDSRSFERIWMPALRGHDSVIAGSHPPHPRLRPLSARARVASPPTRAHRAGRGCGRPACRRRQRRTSRLPARETRRHVLRGPARTKAPQASRAEISPRDARTGTTGTEASASAITAATMSPPWFTSATSASASQPVIERDRGLRPFAPAAPRRASRRPARRPFRLHPCPPRRCRSDRPARCEAAGGSTATTMRTSARRNGGTARFQHVARPQRADALLDDLAVDLLPAEPRAAIFLLDGGEERRREILRIGACRGARHGVAADRPSVSSAAAAAAASSSPVRAAMCRAAGRTAACPRSPADSAISRVRRTTRPRIAARAGFPDLRPKRPARSTPFGQVEPPPRRFPFRPFVALMHGENAGDALDHHVARIGPGFADKRDALRPAFPRNRGSRAPALAPIRRRRASCPRRARRRTATPATASRDVGEAARRAHGRCPTCRGKPRAAARRAAREIHELFLA